MTDPMDAGIPAAVAKLKELPLKDASMVLDLTLGAIGGSIKALTALTPFSDDDVYDLVHKSLPRMLEHPGGLETLQAIAAAAFTRIIRQEHTP